MPLMRVTEIVELNYKYIIVKTRNRLKPKLRYVVPLQVPIIPDDPFELNVSGVAYSVSWDEEKRICTTKLTNIEVEDLVSLDSYEIYEEIVEWWKEQQEDGLDGLIDALNAGTYLKDDKHLKYQEIKEKIDLLRLFRKRFK